MEVGVGGSGRVLGILVGEMLTGEGTGVGSLNVPHPNPNANYSVMVTSQ